jgi:hypothetical protein
MAKESSYWEGWGFSDRIPMYFSATKRNIEKLLAEFKKTYPKNPVEQVNPKVLQVMATDSEIKNMKRIASVFNAKLSYAEGGQLEGMGISPLDANPYVAGAKTAKAIAPKSVDALDIRLARRINPDPNRPIFFSHGGDVKKMDWYTMWNKPASNKVSPDPTPDQSAKVAKVMREFKEGTLRSSSGDLVTKRDQAIAIALSEAGLSKYEQGGVAPTIGGTMETSMSDAPMIGGTMASSLFADGGTTGETTVAKVILEQLGGINKLVVMTGAYNFVALPSGIYFKIKNRKVNYVKIRLNEKDLYDVLFGKIVSGKVKTQSEHFDVYFDQLKPIFEKETGMYLTF